MEHIGFWLMLMMF